MDNRGWGGGEILITARLLYIASAAAFGLATMTAAGTISSNFYADAAAAFGLAVLARAVETPK